MSKDFTVINVYKEEDLKGETKYKTSENMVCVICEGFYPFLAKEAYGLRPNRNHNHVKALPDFFICWECVHWLFKVFSEQLRGLSYNLLTSEGEQKQ